MKRKIVWSLTAMLAGTGFAAAQENIELASVRMASGTAARTGTISQHDCAVGCSNGNSCSSFGNDYRLYGRAEVLVWQLGSTFRQSGLDTLPAFRDSMPYGFRSASYNITDPLNPILFETKDISGVAKLDPSILTGSGLDGQDRTGGRITIGMFLDSNHDWGAELSYFQLERKTVGFRGTASVNNVQFQTGLSDITITTIVSGDPPLPVNVLTETPVVFDADLAASIEGTASSQLYGFEANVNHRSFTIGNTVVSEIYGLRYLDLEFNHLLTQFLSVTDDRYIIDEFGNPTTSTTFLGGEYRAYNQFYAAQVGARFDTDLGRFYLNGFGKLAFGAMRQSLSAVEVVGNTDVDIPFEVYPAPTVYREERTRLAFALEGSLNAGFHITEHCSVFAGYNILVMTRVAQMNGGGAPANGGGTIDLGTAARPIPVSNLFKEDRYYAHGLNLGLELRY